MEGGDGENGWKGEMVRMDGRERKVRIDGRERRVRMDGRGRW
jgi:hypothetical protein